MQDPVPLTIPSGLNCVKRVLGAAEPEVLGSETKPNLEPHLCQSATVIERSFSMSRMGELPKCFL